MILSEYKDIFGKPNEGVHKYRVCDIAIVDVIATIIGAYILSISLKQEFKNVLVVLFLLGIFFHYIFGVKTTVHRFLFQ